jgi:hypothetical protein
VNLLPPEYWLREHDARREEIMREIAALRVPTEPAPRRRRRWWRAPRSVQPVVALVPCETAPC